MRIDLIPKNETDEKTAAPARLLLRLLLFAAIVAFAIVYATVARGEVTIPSATPSAPIDISAPQTSRWQEGSYEVWHLRGGCRIVQADVRAQSKEAILWIDRSDNASTPDTVIAYLEGSVIVESRGNMRQPQRIMGETWFGRFHSTSGVRIRAATPNPPPRVQPAIYARALEAHRTETPPAVQPAQFTAPPARDAEVLPAPNTPAFGSVRRVLVQPRGSVKFSLVPEPDPGRNGTAYVSDTGVKITVEGVRSTPTGPAERIVILSDRVVIWTPAIDDFAETRELIQRGEVPLEFYLEGNIVFAQGDRVIYAERMYYNVNGKYGTILNAEMLTDVPEHEGLLRIKAKVLQQLDEQNFAAFGAAVTSSRMGYPKYWFQSGSLEIHDEPVRSIDPFTGEETIKHNFSSRSRNNLIYFGGVPIFYWPVLASDASEPTYYIERFSIKSDQVFGTQVLTDLDMFQLLGIGNPPAGTDWTLTADWLSDRGFGVGTGVQWQRDDFFGIQGPTRGMFDAWGIKDEGLDNLGLDRRALVPEKEFRGRILGQHRQRLDIGFQVTAELGLTSDRNFLEQYYEREWDLLKDQTTGAELKWLRASHSLNVNADVRLNDFFTQTEWLPRGDHFLTGQSVLFDRLTWFAHTHVGYGRLETAGLSTNPADPMLPLAWETDTGGTQYAERQGARLGTRHELDLPLAVGPVKVVPYLLGDITYWGEDVDGDDATRLYGQAGLRASIPVWKANPTVRNALFNLNGMAHKISYEGELFFADADQDIGRFPLYDSVDDDAQESFRRRFLIPDGPFFGLGAIPFRFDERSFATRSGMQSWVAAPSAEIAEDLTIAHVAVRQRWQTKRGLPGRERIIDWVVLDVEGSFFPDAARDNFGAEFGQANYDFRWHIGDRVALLSDGYFDFFSQGLRTASLGGVVTRPENGSLYVGFRSIEGPITSNILSASIRYRMSEKWIGVAGTSYDFGPTGNVGQSVSAIRIGESFLVRLGVNVDASRGNFGVSFGIEPRFLPNNRLGMVGGVQIPPAGSRGLE